jgi:hypothetical protein
MSTRSDSWCALTDAGRRLRELAQSSIQAAEEGLLTVLAPVGRAGFLNALRLLSTAPVGGLLAGD